VFASSTIGQLSLSEPLNRYFFAIVPQSPVAMEIDRLARDLRRSHRLRGTVIGPDRYHISLCGVAAPGPAPAQTHDALRRIGDRILAAPFDVGFDHAVSFGQAARKRPLVLARSDAMPGLERLQARLRQAMTSCGMPIARQFNPHLTLLYDEKLVAASDVPLLRWTVRDFVLIRSVHGESRHEHLGRWPLRGGSPAVAA
jgi:2'-5' RNA ligase